MSSGQQDPYGPNRYADPVQEHVPGQRGEAAPGGQPAYSGYPHGSEGESGPGGGFPPGGGYRSGMSGYLQGAPVGFAGAVRGAFSHLLTFRGRASRSAFWWFALLAVVAWAVLGVIRDRSTVAGAILYIVIGLPLWVASITLAVRRLHDSGHTGWWWWIGLVPLVGWIVLLVFYITPGTSGPNRYNRGA